jgi:hypothetical protein
MRFIKLFHFRHLSLPSESLVWLLDVKHVQVGALKNHVLRVDV